MMVIYRNPKTMKMEAKSSLIITCGCGGIGPVVSRALKSGDLRIPRVQTTSNAVRKFVKQEGLERIFPSLTKGKHAVLYNPKTTKGIDLLANKNAKDLVIKVKEVING